MRQIVTGDSLVLDIENHNFVNGDKNFVPYDPKVGVLKVLRITYCYDDGPALSIVRQEHSRLVLPEDSEIEQRRKAAVDKYLEAEAFAEKLVMDKNVAESELFGVKKRIAEIEKLFCPLQIDAIRLSADLLDFLKRIGPPPSPKYTAEDIEKMTSVQMRSLIDAHDGDFLEACEYYRPGGIPFSPTQLESQLTSHMKRLFPWYQRVAASYALELQNKVETMRNRLAVEGMADSIFSLSVEGRDGEKTIRAMAAKLWELAFKLGEKGIP